MLITILYIQEETGSNVYTIAECAPSSTLNVSCDCAAVRLRRDGVVDIAWQRYLCCSIVKRNDQSRLHLCYMVIDLTSDRF